MPDVINICAGPYGWLYDYGIERPRVAQVVGRIVWGIDLAPLYASMGAVAELPDERCQCPHWGYVLRGRMTFRFADREEVVEAGDAFYLPPGHVPIAEAGTEYVQFSPAEELKVVGETLEANMRAMMAAGGPPA